MGSYAEYTRVKLHVQPTLVDRARATTSCDLEADLLRMSLEGPLFLTTLRAISPRDYSERRAWVHRLTAPGQAILWAAEHYQNLATELVNLQLDGPLYDAQRTIVDVSKSGYLQRFHGGLWDLQDCFLHSLFALLTPDADKDWQRSQYLAGPLPAPTHADIYVRGMNTIETVMAELRLIKAHTLQMRGEL